MNNNTLLASNVVIFGPAHCGKSTLCGFLLSRSFEIAQWEQRKRKLQQEIGSDYDRAQKFAYLLDTSKDERRRKSGHLGTSHVMHIAKVGLEKLDGSKSTWTIIDTPGSQHGERERVKGMFFGDVGVFMIEATALIGLKLGLTIDDSCSKVHNTGQRASMERVATDFLAPLMAWNKFGKSRTLIVALSKMDDVEYSQSVFDDARRILFAAISNQPAQLQVVPIAISVDDELSHNVLAGSDKMPWYTGDCLTRCIEKSWEYSGSYLETSTGDMIVIDRTFQVRGIGEVLRGKVLRGAFSRGDAIQIGPLKSKDPSMYFAHAILRDIKVNETDVGFAREGDICTLKLTYSGKLNHTLSRTSIISRRDGTSCFGSVLQLEPAAEPITCELLELIKIIWFGKLVTCDVISTRDDGTLFLYVQGSALSLPVVGNELVFKSFFLKKGETDIYKYTLKNLALDVYVRFDIPANSVGSKQFTDHSNPCDAISAVKSVSRLKKLMAHSGELLTARQVIVELPPRSDSDSKNGFCG